MQCKHPGPLAVVVLFPFCFFSLESKKIEKKNEGKRQDDKGGRHRDGQNDPSHGFCIALLCFGNNK